VARAGQGVGAAPGARRLGFALAASLLAHGALLGALPRPWHAALSPGEPAATLQVSFVAPAAEPARAAPAAKRAQPAEARYLSGSELDQRPQILSHVEPNFPALALAPVGRVVLRLYVDETGRVDSVAVESDDPNGAFAASAREAFAAARFLPGMKGGVPVKALLRFEVLFGSPHPDNAR